MPAAGAYLALGEVPRARAGRTATDDGVLLGEFSDGFDGWTTTGGNDLARVDEEDVPVGVRVGTHALAVEVDGDRHPMIENKKRVREADFVEYPYLLAHVVGIARNTDSDLVLTFRLHHTATPADGGNGGGGGDGGNGGGNGGGKGGGPGGGDGGGPGSKDVLVVESDERTVAQLDPGYVRWDLTDIDEEVLRTAKRLEIAWYLEDNPPERGHRGRDPGEYEGVVVFDDVRLTDEVAAEEAAASREKRRSLHREHGMIVGRSFEEQSESVERGTLEFVDGTEVPFSMEFLDDGRYRYTVDGETFLLGGETA